MNKFVSTLGNTTFTENNMPTNKSSLNPLLDLFYRIGNRNADVIALAKNALEYNSDLAVKIIGWSRSIRNGAGVRNNLRTIIDSGIIDPSEINWQWFGKNGYWKDLFYFDPDKIDPTPILMVVKDALDKEDNLMLKWLPRRKRDKKHKNSRWVYLIRKFLNITEKEYRQICRKYVTVETLMCANRWSEIIYQHVPSKSFQRNRKAFFAHDERRISDFLSAAVEGKTEVKAGAVYPHEIVRMLDSYYADENTIQLAEAQWKNLPNKFESDKKIFVVADTSGSMSGEPMQISKSLAIYCAERITGPFHNFCAIFSERPAFFQFKDTDSLYEKYNSMFCINALNTNIEALFDLIVYKAITEKISPEDMPEMIMIISDMQFDQGIANKNHNINELIASKYAQLGEEYKIPVIVYWNVRNSYGIPVTQNDKGVVLFSGASPNTIAMAIQGKCDPIESMLNVIDKNEYYFLKK